MICFIDGDPWGYSPSLTELLDLSFLNEVIETLFFRRVETGPSPLSPSWEEDVVVQEHEIRATLQCIKINYIAPGRNFLACNVVHGETAYAGASYMLHAVRSDGNLSMVLENCAAGASKEA